MNRILIFAGLGLALGMPGCKVTSPTGPVAPAITGLNILNQVQKDLEDAQPVEIAAVKAGLIDKATDIKIQTALAKEAVDSDALAQALQTAASTATVQAKIDAITADLQQDIQSGVLGVKDTKTQATLSASVALAEIALNGVMSAYTAAGK
jgi:hypothetical protein